MSNRWKRGGAKDVLIRYFLLIATVLTGVMFAVCEPNFLKVSNLLDILRAAAITGICSVGLTIVQASGEFDFAVGAQSSLAAVVIAKLMVESIPNFYICFAVTMVLSVLVGLFHSFLVLNLNIRAWVATFGVSTLLNGVCKYMTGGGTFYSMSWPSGFSMLGQGFLFGLVPIPAILFILVVAAAFVFCEHTRTGRYIYAVGSNAAASQHVGIDCVRQKRLSFLLCSLCCGFAGIVQASMLSSVTPNIGDSNMLPAISTCMLGATFLKPGVFNICGSAVGALLMAVISNGLTMIGASYFMKDIIQGVVLIFAVGFVAVINKGRR
ncbi:MAG: ABC transporter permease [Clostridiaceae bacterium]|nr:ABC transporter permease [Clostridiaceae bacterium]MCI9484140.1 ABC transporter permease [Clostridiaceae bacterium]NBI81879.1 ABC transporter permease [Clostridiaceae bacterium]